MKLYQEDPTVSGEPVAPVKPECPVPAHQRELPEHASAMADWQLDEFERHIGSPMKPQYQTDALWRIMQAEKLANMGHKLPPLRQRFQEILALADTHQCVQDLASESTPEAGQVKLAS